MQVTSVVRLLGQSLAALLQLVAKCGYLVPFGFYRKRKGLQLFTQELQQAGLDPETIRSLTHEYRRLGSISQWIQRDHS